MLDRHHSFLRRALALAVCLTLLLPTLALAIDMGQTLLVGVQWTDGQGVSQYAPAVPIPYPGYEGCYWVQVPGDALYGLSLSVQDLSGRCAYFSPADGEPFPGPIMDAGSGLNNAVPQEIVGFTADGQPALFLRLYISTVTAVPEMPAQETPAPVIPDAEVTVRYMSREGLEIASATRKTLPAGTHEIYPEAWDLQPDYVLSGPSSQTVTVNEYGASSAEVIFYYDYVKPPVQPVNVVVHYLDAASGANVASDTVQTMPEGTNPVYPAPYDLQPNYEPTGEQMAQVTVDEYGANPAEVTFYYNYVKPPVRPVDVLIHYVDDATGESIAADTVQTVPEGVTDVYAAPETLPPDYVPVGATFCPVTVDENGANPAEVTFRYIYEAPVPTTAMLTARCVDQADGTTVSTFQQEVRLGGENDVYLPAIPEGYTLSGADVVRVYVDENGVPSPEPVFYLVKDAPIEVPPVQITVRYLDKDTDEPVALDQVAQCAPGQNTVITADPVGLMEGYVPAGSSEVSVWVDENGQTESSEVVFYYEKEALLPTEAPVVVEPRLVVIRYLDESGAPIAQETSLLFQPGDTPVTAPETIGENYVLAGEGTAVIHVDENGASPETVEFVYRLNQTVPKIALVPVKYLDVQSGIVFYSDSATCQENSENLITVDREIAAQCGYGAYEPDMEAVSVLVDSSGEAFPAEVVFSFTKAAVPTEAPTEAPTEIPVETPVPVSEAPVTVLYQTREGMPVASAQEVVCYPGTNQIEARPYDLAEGYTLIGESICHVVMDASGALNPAQVVFLYAEEDAPLPQIGTVDRWGETNTTVNFRTGMSKNADRVKGKEQLKSKTRVFVRAVDEAEGQRWYAVTVNGKEGYLAADYVNVYSKQESDAIQSSLASPVPTVVPPTEVPPTEAPATEVPPTEIPVTDAPATELPPTEVPPTETPEPPQEATPAPLPQVGVIDRWGETNTKVNFRTRMDTNADRVKGKEQINNKTRVWVQTSDMVENQQWYAVTVDGREGYIAAEFVDVYSQEVSDNIQRTLPSAAPTQTPDRTPVPATEVPPTEVPPTETPAATATPEPYSGYAVTQWQVALRPGVSDTDVLEVLANDSLVYISGQTVVDDKVYSAVQAMASGNYGFMEDRALLHITNDEAKPYLEKLLPAEVTPSPVPEQQQGFAMTQGDGVPLRAFADTNGAISQLLPYGAVARVTGQAYTGGVAWHLVQYNGEWGYVRADQMRMLDEDETIAYLQSQEHIVVTPTPAPTPEPVTPDSPSSYGHVRSNSGKVNMRDKPSMSGQRLKMLDNFAFALVLGKVENEEGTWYHISQGGTEGYVSGSYFKVLSLSELSTFLMSDEYESGNSETSQTGASSSKIQPVEDFNRVVWQNPALSPSYEPFNPYATATPNPEALPTPTAEPTAEPTPTVTPEILTLGGITTPEPATTGGGGSAWPWVLLGLAAVGGGGAYYAYTVYRRNERRRQAVRAQQMQRARQNQAANRPQMQAARNNPAQQGGNGTGYTPSSAAPFMPPQSGAPTVSNAYPAGTAKPASAQGSGTTQKYTPVGASQSAAARQETRSYEPIQTRQTDEYRSMVYKPAEPVKPAQQADSGNAENPAEEQHLRRSDRYKNDQA